MASNREDWLWQGKNEDNDNDLREIANFIFEAVKELRRRLKKSLKKRKSTFLIQKLQRIKHWLDNSTNRQSKKTQNITTGSIHSIFFCFIQFILIKIVSAYPKDH